MKIEVSIIVTNFNKKELLFKCLHSLVNLKYENYQIILVDNGSDDRSAEMVRKHFPGVLVIEMGYNSGFCKANNAGIRYALQHNFGGVVILNNDTEVDSNFLREIVKAADVRNKIGMVSAQIILHDKRDTMDTAGFLITPDGLGKNIYAGESVNDAINSREVFCPSGAATFYTRELLEDVKEDDQYFDEDYQYYYEELDMGWRARLRGWKCTYSPGAIVYHHKSATAGPYSEFIAYYTNRNIFFNIIKNYPSCYYLTKALFLSFFRYFFLVCGVVFYKGVGHKINRSIGYNKVLKVFLKSVKDALVVLIKMLKKRMIIQNRKRVDKKEIRRWFNELGLSFFDSIYKL